MMSRTYNNVVTIILSWFGLNFIEYGDEKERGEEGLQTIKNAVVYQEMGSRRETTESKGGKSSPIIVYGLVDFDSMVCNHIAIV